jgi:hypothetical protein
LDKQDFIIKENSFVARMAAFKLGTESVAMVLGKTIHLHNAGREEFLQNKRFIVKYVWESIRKGYYNNKYEAEARAAELL